MTRTNLVVLKEGMNALKEKLGLVDSERFINLIIRENFNYTEWQKDLWNEKSVREIHEEAKNFYNK
jgi:hypothetical protein